MRMCPWFLAVIALAIAFDAAAVAQSKRPNILVIVADDLGYGELGCQGNPQIATPHIDSLAKSGIRFTSGYVSGPYCSPTRAGLLTGRYQQRYGHEFNPGPAPGPDNFGLSLKETTLADRLKSAGYATGMFGKWHLGYRDEYHPLKRGFDAFFGFLGGAHSYINAAADGQNPILRGTRPVNDIDYTTEAFAREAVAFIDRHRDKPWFVYLPFNAVHAPLQTPAKYRQRFPNITNARRQTFAAMLSAMDDAIGSVLAKLREHRLEENTLVFFVSDNGGPTANNTSRNDPLRGRKAQVWEGGIRVPFLIQWKGRIPGGKVDDRPIIQLDVVPTAIAAAGLEVKADWKLDSVDLLPYLAGDRKEAPHASLFWRFGRQRAVRMGAWKLTDVGEGAQLFHITKDIGESEDLAGKEPERLKQLEAAYSEWNTSNVPPRWRDPAMNRRRNSD